MDKLLRDYKKKNPHKVIQTGGDDVELYTSKDKVVILNDKSLIESAKGVKITGSSFKGPGILEAYAVWCPHCQNKANGIVELAGLMHENDSNKKIYVLDVTKNNDASAMLGVEFMPSFYLVGSQGSILKKVEVKDLSDIVAHLGLTVYQG